MTAQLTFDALPEWRTRDGIWPIEAHERGWVRLPERLVGKFGDGSDYTPGWVCCRCGGVELNSDVLCLNHGCCFWPWRQLYDQPRSCTWLKADERARRGLRQPPAPGPFWELWLPGRPP